jgi:hypothetical protein
VKEPESAQPAASCSGFGSHEREELLESDRAGVPHEISSQHPLANYLFRTRRPELFGELVRDQVSS